MINDFLSIKFEYLINLQQDEKMQELYPITSKYNPLSLESTTQNEYQRSLLTAIAKRMKMIILILEVIKLCFNYYNFVIITLLLYVPVYYIEYICYC